MRLILMWCLTLCFISAGSRLAQAENIEFRGVEIGSNGVKSISLIFNLGTWDVGEKKANEVLGAEVLKDASGEAKQLGLVSSEFKDIVVDNVADVTTRMLKMAPESVPLERRFVVISSGVVAVANPDEKKKQALAKLRSLIKERAGVDASEISVDLEVKHSFDELLGSDDSAHLSEALLIDIGGGNTKFGTYLGGSFVVGEIPHGAARDLNLFEKLKTNEEIQNAIKKLQNDVASKLRDELKRTGLDKFRPRYVYLVGGSVFSMMAQAQPGDLVATQDGLPDPIFATINRESLSTYRTVVATGNNDSEPAVANLTGSHKKKAEDRSKLARRIFSIGQRRPAQALLEAVFDAFDLNDANREITLRFPVNGNYAWLTGYMRDRASKDSSLATLFWMGEQFRQISKRADDRNKALTDKLDEIDVKSKSPAVNLEEISNSVAAKLSKELPKQIVSELKLDELTKKLTDDISKKIPTPDEIAEKVKPIDTDALVKKLNAVIAVDLAKVLLDKLDIPTAKKIASELKLDELTKKMIDDINAKIPTAEEIAKNVKPNDLDALAEKVNVAIAADLAKTLLEKLKIPTPEDIAKLVNKNIADGLAKELIDQLKIPTVKEIADEVTKTVAKDVAQEIKDKLKFPSAEDIATAVSIKVPSAKDIAKEVKGGIPSAKDIAKEVVVPNADDIASKVKVNTATASEIAALIEIPTAEKIASMVKVPTAKEIAAEINSSGYNRATPQTTQTISPLVPHQFDQCSEAEIELESQDVLSPNPAVARRIFQMGRDDYEHNRIPAAHARFIEATRLNPKDALMWYFRSLSEVRKGLFVEAEASAQRAAELLRTKESYSELCQRLERVQGSDRQVVQRYLDKSLISVEKTIQPPSPAL